MKALALFNLILTYSNFAFSQSNYIVYSNYINKAELRITDKKFSEALIYYDSALSVKKIPFARDAYNAAVCAAIVKNNNKCYSYLKTLIDKGSSLKYIQSVDVLNDFLKTKNGRQLVEYTKHNDVHYNRRLRSIIDSLEAADQFFRQKEGKYAVYMDTIKKIDASNAFSLVKFVDQYGFPSEEMIGINDDILTLQLPYYAIIAHQQNGSPSSVMNFSEILKTALKNGEIEPHIATELIDKSNGEDEYGTEAYGLTKYVLDSISPAQMQYSNPVQNHDSAKWGYVNINVQYETKLNSNRTSIGLGTIKEGRQKGIYEQLRDKRFHLSTYSVYFFDKKDQFEEYSKQLIFVK
jgi:hypothetical protein